LAAFIFVENEAKIPIGEDSFLATKNYTFLGHVLLLEPNMYLGSQITIAAKLSLDMSVSDFLI
jgi:hypothetical protein